MSNNLRIEEQPSQQEGISKQCDLSICIVNWNGKTLTLNCLESLFKNTQGITFEVILVDNGSIDGTVEAVSQLYPVVKIIRNEKNEGFTLPNNQAMRVSVGRYVLLLNNDVLVNDNALKQVIEFMDNHPDVGVSGCRLRFGNGQVQESAHVDMQWWDYIFAAFLLHQIFPKSKLFGRINMSYLDYEGTAEADVDWLAGAMLVVRAEALTQVGMLDEQIFAFCEDWEWCVRFKRHGWRVVYYGAVEITHLHGASSHSKENNKGASVREWTIMTTIASGMYVHTKLHANEPVRNILFNFSRRLFCLSKAALYTAKNILPTSHHREWGLSKGYLKAALSSNAAYRNYLRP